MKNLKDIKYEIMPNIIDTLLPLTTVPYVGYRCSICVIYLCDIKYSRYDMRLNKFISKIFGGDIESINGNIIKLNNSMFKEVVFVDSKGLGRTRGFRADAVFILYENELSCYR